MAALPAPEMELAGAFSRLSPEEKGPIPNFNVELHEVLLQFSESYIGKIAKTARAAILSWSHSKNRSTFAGSKKKNKCLR